MLRRQFLSLLGGSLALALCPPALAATASYRRLLVLVELKGGNDGLNTLVPYASPDYARLRPTLALARDQLLQLDERRALHPALAPLMPLWQAGELAWVEGVGYPAPNLSHFRSIEIWDTASRSDQTLQQGWLSRLFARHPLPAGFAADGVVLASNELGPLAGGARAVVLSDPGALARQARLLRDAPSSSAPPALAHILKVEADVRAAASALGDKQLEDMAAREGRTERNGAFGRAVDTLLAALASGAPVAVARLTLTGFDTHGNQAPTQARLLGELASGVAALRDGLQRQGRWRDTLLVSYAEFGRRPRENGNRGTDHGTVNAHLVSGGLVQGGFYGAPPDLSTIGDGNLPHAVDFRQLWATAIERWWGQESASVLGGRFEPLPLLRA